jgi:hypothetical protein
MDWSSREARPDLTQLPAADRADCHGDRGLGGIDDRDKIDLACLQIVTTNAHFRLSTVVAELDIVGIPITPAKTNEPTSAAEFAVMRKGTAHLMVW